MKRYLVTMECTITQQIELVAADQAAAEAEAAKQAEAREEGWWDVIKVEENGEVEGAEPPEAA